MNATVQTMRAIPELQAALTTFTPSGSTQAGGTIGNANLTRSMRDLFTNMRSTTDAVTPMGFLSVLRQVAPQFGEMARRGESSVPGMAAYAQQGMPHVLSRLFDTNLNLTCCLDAAECWSEISNALKALPGGPSPSNAASDKRFVEQYMMCELRQE